MAGIAIPSRDPFSLSCRFQLMAPNTDRKESRGRHWLLAGYFGHGNAGDEAILAATVQSIRRRASHPPIVAVTADPQGTAAELGVDCVDPGDIPALVAAVRGSSAVVLCGGGLFQDYWSSDPEHFLTRDQGGLLGYLAYPVLAFHLGRPLLIHAAGVGPIHTEEGRQQTRLAFSLAVHATLRDEASREWLRTTGFASSGSLEIVADPGFALEPASPAAIVALVDRLGLPPASEAVTVALRPWPFGPDREAWEQAVAGALDMVAERHRLHVVFLPLQVDPTGPDEDLSIQARVAAALSRPDRVHRIDSRLAASELAGWLAGSRAVLAMRMHAALWALAGGTPTVAMAYDPKVTALMQSAGATDGLLPPDSWNRDALFAALERALARPTPSNPSFGVEMRRRAVAGLDRLVTRLEEAAAEQSTEQRLLSELFVSKVLSVCALRDSLADTSARLETAWREVAAHRTWVDGLKSELAAVRDRGAIEQEVTRLLRGELREAHAQSALTLRQRGEALAERDAARKRRAAAEAEAARLREQRDLTLRERDEALRRLAELESTLGYRALSQIWRLLRRLLPEGSRRHRIYRRLRGSASGRTPLALGAPAPVDLAVSQQQATSGPETEQPGDPWRALVALEDRSADRETPAVVFLSAVWLLESEGQRPTQLALEIARRGWPVGFCYWRWWPHEWAEQDRIDAGIAQIPIDLVLAHPERLARAFAGHRRRIAIVAFPHPDFFELVAALHASGWIVIYDVVDDWEEFHRVGQAVWFDDPFERHLLLGADAVFAVNAHLAERVRLLGRAEVAVVGNGLKTGIEQVHEERPLPRGEVTVGYFGYLAGAWFDWALVAASARLRPSWRFYLIGYGGAPEGIELPGNVVLLGRQPQSNLAGFAANWDVAIVPFKPDRLAIGADPIKTYEYLAMGLPVVVTGVYPPPGTERFVRRVEGAAEFVAALAAAAAASGDATEIAARREHAAGCSWSHRLDAMLDVLDRGEQRVAEKLALLGATNS